MATTEQIREALKNALSPQDKGYDMAPPHLQALCGLETKLGLDTRPSYVQGLGWVAIQSGRNGSHIIWRQWADPPAKRAVAVVPERNIAIRRMLLPRDTNHRGEIFGGAIMAEIDLAGAVEARRHTEHDVATVAVKEIEFRHPVPVGHEVTFYTSLVRIGRTSITVRVEVESGRGMNNQVCVTATEVVYVAVQRDKQGGIRKVPVQTTGPCPDCEEDTAVRQEEPCRVPDRLPFGTSFIQVMVPHWRCTVCGTTYKDSEGEEAIDTAVLFAARAREQK